MTNADEVKAFIEDHKGGQWTVGDSFVLPDIEQTYEVVAVRPFKRRGKFHLFVDLEAACAMCEEYFITTKEVHQWMTSPHLTRCCPTHRYGFTTHMANAWKTQEQIAALPVKVAKVREPRVGANERAVMEAVGELALVADAAGLSEVVERAVAKLPAGTGGKRDTRRQSVVRALRVLAGAGRVGLEGERVRL
jgi:hypothetical protein